MTTQTDLLDIAEGLARRRGYDGFSFGDLATRSGIQKPSVHYHFATKGALAADLIARYTARMQARLDEIETAETTRAGKLRAFIEVYREALGAGDTICLCAAFAASRGSLPTQATDALDAFYTAVLDWLGDVFDGDDDEAMAMLALVEGAQLMARARQDVKAFDQAVAPTLAQMTQ